MSLDGMFRIGIVGGPGSGKSSLARQVTIELYNKRQLNAQYITEFARDHINACRAQQDGKFYPSLADQLLIYHEQVFKETMLPDAVSYVITDSPVFLPVVFAADLCDMSMYQDRRIFLHLYSDFLAKYLRWYDLVIMLEREKGYLRDGTRGESPEEADDVGRRLEAFLVLHGIDHHKIKGTDEQRVVEVVRLIEEAREELSAGSSVFGE